MALQGQGQDRDNEALGLPQNYLTPNHDPLPSLCVWLLADATCNMSPSKEADEGKTTKQQNSQREETLGSSPCPHPLYFISGRVLIDLTVSHSHDWCLNTALSVYLCFQGVIWHSWVGMYRWINIQKICTFASLFYQSSSMSLEEWKPSKNNKKKIVSDD